MSYGTNSIKNIFVKEKDGVKAPAGFHYMPNGRLMSDADHVAVNGYIEQRINSFEVDTVDILNGGQTRGFRVLGDENAVFSIEIFDNTGEYYNFYTQTWSTEKAMLRNKKIGSEYSIDVKFKALPDSSLKTYTVNLHAETIHNIRTTHADYIEARNADNSININKSTGSNSNVLTKIIYQDALKTLKLSAIAPSLYNVSSNTVNGGTSSSNRIVIDGSVVDPNIVQVGDKVVTTGIASAVHAIVTKVDPDSDNLNELEISVSDSATNDADIEFTPPFNGMLPHDDESDTGASSISVSSGQSDNFSFSVTLQALTGRTFSVLKTPTTDDLCTYQVVTFGSAALAIEDENTDSGAKFHRWPVNNISNLKKGMVLDPSRSGTGINTTTPAFISDYKATSVKKIIVKGDYDNYINEETTTDLFVSGVDAFANDVTAVDRNGRVTAQAGNIAFNTQQNDALKSDANVRIFAYGKSGIKALTGVDVELTVASMAYFGIGEDTAPLSLIDSDTGPVSTTTSGATVRGTTIGLTEVGNISEGMVVSGPGINSAVENPTVVSKSAISGAGNIIVTTVQTVESGQTLFFDKGTPTLTIRGSLRVYNMGISDINIFFDVERFLEAL